MAAHDLRVPEYLESTRLAIDAAVDRHERATAAVDAARLVVARREAVGAVEREMRAIGLVLAHLEREHERIGSAWLAGDPDADGALPLLDRLLRSTEDANTCAVRAAAVASRVALPPGASTYRYRRVRPGGLALPVRLRDAGRRAPWSGSCRPGDATPPADADGTH